MRRRDPPGPASRPSLARHACGRPFDGSSDTLICGMDLSPCARSCSRGLHVLRARRRHGAGRARHRSRPCCCPPTRPYAETWPAAVAGPAGDADHRRRWRRCTGTGRAHAESWADRRPAGSHVHRLRPASRGSPARPRAASCRAGPGRRRPAAAGLVAGRPACGEPDARAAGPADAGAACRTCCCGVVEGDAVLGPFVVPGRTGLPALRRRGCDATQTPVAAAGGAVHPASRPRPAPTGRREPATRCWQSWPAPGRSRDVAQPPRRAPPIDLVGPILRLDRPAEQRWPGCGTPRAGALRRPVRRRL